MPDQGSRQLWGQNVSDAYQTPEQQVRNRNVHYSGAPPRNSSDPLRSTFFRNRCTNLTQNAAFIVEVRCTNSEYENPLTVKDDY